MHMDLVEVGIRIRNCRKALKLTQEELSERVNVSSHYIYEIEKGLKTMSLFTLVDVSKSLNVSVDYILFGEDVTIDKDNIPELSDRLFIVSKEVPYNQREHVADIINVMLPYLK